MARSMARLDSLVYSWPGSSSILSPRRYLDSPRLPDGNQTSRYLSATCTGRNRASEETVMFSVFSRYLQLYRISLIIFHVLWHWVRNAPIRIIHLSGIIIVCK